MEIKRFLRFSLSATNKDVPVVFEHVAFTPDGKRFCATTNIRTVYLGDVIQNKVKFLHKLDLDCSAICVIQKVDGKEVAVIGTTSGSLIALDIETGHASKHDPVIEEPLHHISTHPSADRVVTSYNSSAVVWNLTEAVVPVQRLKISESADLLQASFGSDGSSVVTCFCDGRIIIWNFPALDFRSHLRPKQFIAPLISASISSDGLFLAATGTRPILVLWDLIHNEDDPELIDLSDDFADMKQIEFLTSDDLTVLICLGSDGAMKPFDIATKTEIKTFRKSKSDRRYAKIVTARHLDSESHLIGALEMNGSLDIINLKLQAKGMRPNIPQDPLGSPPVSQTPKPVMPSRTEQVAPDLDIVGVDELDNILRTFGEFPDKYRFLIWRHALQLPQNKEAFATLLERGIHPMFDDLQDVFDVSDQSLLLDLKKVLSALAYWCALFAEVNYLPSFVFPFVKVLRHDLLTCFEIIVTCIVNWCHNWFECFPAPPFNILAEVDMLLERDCPGLLEYFTSKDVTAQVYAWPLLKSLFSEVFTRDEWLKVWDHIVLNKNDRFLLAITAAYSIVSQHSLLECRSEADCKSYFREKNPIPLKPVLERAAKLLDLVIHPGERKTHTFRPLSKDTYPIFHNFPHAVVENHRKELQKIRQLEAEYLLQRKATLEIEAKYGTVIEQEDDLRRREAILTTAELLRRQEIVEEDRRLGEQRSRLRVLTKELQDRELALLEAHRRSLNQEKMVHRERGINQLEDELRLRAVLRESELRDAVEMAEMRQLRILADNCRQNADVMRDVLDSS